MAAYGQSLDCCLSVTFSISARTSAPWARRLSSCYLPKTGFTSVVFGLISLLLQIFVPYTSYVKYLKWLTLSLFAYVATAFFVKISWVAVLHATVLPQLSWDKEYLTGLIAVLGTTISPYLFFWQASQEVEDLKCTRGDKPLKRAKRQAPFQLGRIRVDTYLGMALSNVVAFFIILTTAATLHAHGQTDVSTAAQAAQALAPLGGKMGFHPVRMRDHRDRDAGDTRAGGLCRIRRGRRPQLECEPGGEAKRCPRLLFGDCRLHAESASRLISSVSTRSRPSSGPPF